jgi:integrase
MARYTKREFQVGEWWLGRKRGRPGWFRCRTEGRQVRRVSLGTVHVGEAKERLTSWFLSEQRGSERGPSPVVTLDEVLLAYYEAHGKFVASAADVKISSRLWSEFFGEVLASDACDVDRIDKFKRWLSAKEYSPGYINRVLSVGRAALMRAHERRLIRHQPIIKGIAGHRGAPKGLPMSLTQLRTFYSAILELHLQRFFLLGLATGARPDALKELEWSQVDLKCRLLALNPAGRLQTKKRRAAVPVCEALAEFLGEWGPDDAWQGPVVHFRGRAVDSVKTSWRKARLRARMGDECNPYSLRHTVGKWLRAESVPPWEVAAVLGHRLPGYNVTEMYAAADPNHMTATKLALDKLVRAVCVPPSLAKLERAKGFEPSTLTLAT